jgi:hypothetical protein
MLIYSPYRVSDSLVQRTVCWIERWPSQSCCAREGVTFGKTYHAVRNDRAKVISGKTCAANARWILRRISRARPIALWSGGRAALRIEVSKETPNRLHY